MMTEKVARAICLAELGDEFAHGEARCCQAGGTEGCCSDSFNAAARAAIKAMQEPTAAFKRSTEDR